MKADRIRAPYGLAADRAKGEAAVSRGMRLAGRLSRPHRTAEGVTVALVGRDVDRPVLARCPICRRVIAHGHLEAGTIVLQCKHCRVPVAVTT